MATTERMGVDPLAVMRAAIDDAFRSRALNLYLDTEAMYAVDKTAVAAVAELVEAAADFKAKTLPPGSDDYSANDAAEYAVAFRRFSAALAPFSEAQS